MPELAEYEVTFNGVTTTMQLSAEDAKRLGAKKAAADEKPKVPAEPPPGPDDDEQEPPAGVKRRPPVGDDVKTRARRPAR